MTSSDLRDQVLEDSAGGKYWFNVRGQRHRIGGPAIEYANGVKCWYFYDLLHRIDGPAVIYSNGMHYFYYKGERISEKIYYSDEFQCKMIMEA
jgi:hypothetical protein